MTDRFGRGTRILGALLLVAVIAAALAYVIARPASSAVVRRLPLDEQYRWVAERLRCQVCEGISVWDSDAQAAWDMKDDIKTKLLAGEMPDHILDKYVHQYGAWILMQPPVRGFYFLAWFTPLFALGAGGLFLGRMVLGSRKELSKSGKDEGGGSDGFDAAQAMDETMKEKISERLKEYD